MLPGPYEEAPKITYDASSNTLYIRGNSYLEDARSFYEQNLIRWFEQNSQLKDLTIYVEMGHMNTPTQKVFGYVIAQLKGKMPLPHVSKIIAISNEDLENDEVVNICQAWARLWGAEYEERPS